jgi:hypothetical protein
VTLACPVSSGIQQSTSTGVLNGIRLGVEAGTACPAASAYTGEPFLLSANSRKVSPVGGADTLARVLADDEVVEALAEDEVLVAELCESPFARPYQELETPMIAAMAAAAIVYAPVIFAIRTASDEPDPFAPMMSPSRGRRGAA